MYNMKVDEKDFKSNDKQSSAPWAYPWGLLINNNWIECFHEWWCWACFATCQCLSYTKSKRKNKPQLLYLHLETYYCQIDYCQALSISLSLNLSLSLRDRDRADTIITFHHHHQHPFIGDLYSSVIYHWNCQLKFYSFPLRKNRVN